MEELFFASSSLGPLEKDEGDAGIRGHHQKGAKQKKKDRKGALNAIAKNADFFKAFFALYAGEIIFQCILGLKAEEERN